MGAVADAVTCLVQLVGHAVVGERTNHTQAIGTGRVRIAVDPGDHVAADRTTANLSVILVIGDRDVVDHLDQEAARVEGDGVEVGVGDLDHAGEVDGQNVLNVVGVRDVVVVELAQQRAGPAAVCLELESADTVGFVSLVGTDEAAAYASTDARSSVL